MNPILLTSSTMSDILPFILAILLIFIIPMLMSRYGISAEDLLAADEENTIRNKKNKKTPHLNNSTHNDIIQMVSDLIIFSRKNKTGLVYPGTIQFGGKTGNIAAFVVTKSKVIGLNCFGFGGRIIHDSASSEWRQQINEVTQNIPDPLKLNQEQYALARAALDANGMKDLPLEIVAVFTNSHVSIQAAQADVCTRESTKLFTASGKRNNACPPYTRKTGIQFIPENEHGRGVFRRSVWMILKNAQ